MFFSKNKGPKITDVVYLNEQGYARAISLWMEQNPNGLVTSWFQLDLEHMRQSLAANTADRFVLADRLAFSQLSGRPLLFAGHYPLRAAELDLCEKQDIKEMLVYSHLDMAMLKLFGSDRIKELMIKMGMAEDEPLSHKMITDAIGNAQDKIAKKNITDMRAQSEEEWMMINVPEK